MKIAFINVYQNQTERGGEIFINEVSKRLKTRHEVKVYSSNWEFPRRVPFLWKLFIDPQSILIGLHTLSIIPELYSQKYDVIIPTNGGWQATFVRFMCIFTKTKMVISGQSGIGWDDRNNLLTFPDAFVALTNSALVWAKKANPFVRSTVIPNGVDLQKFGPKKADLFKELPKPIVLTVGALVKEKRQDLLIKAMAKMEKSSLVIVGKGAEEQALRKLAEKLIPNRYLITDYPHDKMPAVYQSADLFSYPTSPNESFGIVLVEAMASGLPVVATDDPIRREIVGKAGLFPNPLDPKAYAQALEKALNKKWGNTAIKSAEKYNWDEIALQYERLFNEVIKK